MQISKPILVLVKMIQYACNFNGW